MTFSFTVVGAVRGKPRPRFSRGHAYTPTAYAQYERHIADEYMRQGGQMLSGPILVLIEVYRKLPKQRPKRVTFEPDTFKPDADNIAKAVLDALNGVAYADDSQVVELTVRKNPRERRQEMMRIFLTEV